jgi:acetyl esterase
MSTPVLTPLQPLFRRLTAERPAGPKLTTAEARTAAHAMMEESFVAYYAPQAPLAEEADHRIAVDGGSIAVRVYSPGAPGGEALPCHLYLHGGGFWLGTLDHFDPLCRALARDAGCVVASVDYRLAPEHKFPAAAEDSYAALLWVAANAGALGVDPARISVGGMSAGGDLAAVVALMARDRDGPALVLQILEAPVTDLSKGAPLEVPSEGVVLAPGNASYAQLYLADPAQALDPYASPLRAPDLAGLPPALVMCAEYDTLAAEGKAYATRLGEAGVSVEYRCWEGQFHGSQQMAALIPEEAAAYQDMLVSALRRAYADDR